MKWTARSRSSTITREDLACVLLDLDAAPRRAWCRLPEFLQTDARLDRANGSLLVFDEVITFRTESAACRTGYSSSPTSPRWAR
jgi:glutamate-1-semialdehyde aminotransferase